MCVFMHVVHGHCGPLGPYAGPHTSWDPMMWSHVFVSRDGGLAGLVGSVVNPCPKNKNWPQTKNRPKKKNRLGLSTERVKNKNHLGHKQDKSGEH